MRVSGTRRRLEGGRPLPRGRCPAPCPRTDAAPCDHARARNHTHRRAAGLLQPLRGGRGRGAWGGREGAPGLPAAAPPPAYGATHWPPPLHHVGGQQPPPTPTAGGDEGPGHQAAPRVWLPAVQGPGRGGSGGGRGAALPG